MRYVALNTDFTCSVTWAFKVILFNQFYVAVAILEVFVRNDGLVRVPNDQYTVAVKVGLVGRLLLWQVLVRLLDDGAPTVGSC